MDIKLIKSKNIIALVICFCISIISFNFQNRWLYNENLKNTDFYTSKEYEGVLYEIATNSVYTVVGNDASEKMLENKKESRNIISNHTLAQIFIINNDSKEVYSNNIFDFDKYMKKIKDDYSHIYEINFKQNVMYRLEGNEKTRVSTKHFGNLAQERKEDVTTYIAIPYEWDIENIKDTNDKEPLYIRYIQFKNLMKEAYNYRASKRIAGLVMISYLAYYIFINKEKFENKEARNILIKTILVNILLVALALGMSILQSFTYGWSILYPLINTLLLYVVYYYGGILLRHKSEDELSKEELLSKIPILKSVGEIKIKNIKLKNIWQITAIILAQFVLVIMVIDMTYAWYPDYIVVLVWGGIIALPIALIWIIANKISKIEKIKCGINEIKNGNLDYKIEIKKDNLLDDIVEDINEIGEAINIAVEDRLKSERMKNELITNVSHDLKTPLTAMINYISLMKKEDLQPEHVKDYVQVLDKRSQRLKVLIEDLFEASKIGSNNIEMNLEKNDINQLLSQSIVEMEEFIEESRLDFIVNVPQEEVFILADGQKTFRVFENIISNILKYSLEGTRVYIDLEEKDNKVCVNFKNISKYQLNFDADEITERFTRGDLSRHTEGSGLGLAIAKGLVEAQGGSLKIEIIGDLFIVSIYFDTINFK